ncbi:MAG: hypothetical protein ACTSRS_03550 [Candidatus Helarchaeota archaeon]
MAYYYPSSRPQKIYFSKKEIQDLLIATIVITFAFAFALSSNYYYGFSINWEIFPLALLTSLLAVGTGFVFHELGHKFLAIRYGALAEFRAWFNGLLLALMFALLAGFVFATPGAVYIAGPITREQNGKISAMGPFINLTFAGIFFPLLFITSGTLNTIFYFIYYINAFLAAWNLLPFGPLDGVKVLRWNLTIYIILLSSAIALLVPAFIPGLL